MRVTQRRRRQRRALDPNPSRTQLDVLSAQLSLAPPIDGFGDTLPSAGTREELKQAFISGWVSADRTNDYPNYAWHRAGDTVTEFRLVDTAGTYVGYALVPSYWPEGL